jgi:hypothetical protein
MDDGGAPDVCVWAKSWPSVNENDSFLWYASPDPGSRLRVFRLSTGEYFLVRYGDGTDFLINRSGSQVWCRWAPGYSFDYAATYLFGSIPGFLLRLRGIVCLHASVVAMDNWAVAFMGPARAGKSTLATALAEQGFSILSDDILALKESGSGFEALPSYPRVRLWSDSVDALFGSPDALPLITEGWDKRHLDLTAGSRFENRPHPLGAIYVLGERSRNLPGPRIEVLEGAVGLSSLVANTYAYKMFDTEMRRYEFQLLARLANRVPLRSVTPFADLNRIGQLCDLVRGDFAVLPMPADTPGPGVAVDV